MHARARIGRRGCARDELAGEELSLEAVEDVYNCPYTLQRFLKLHQFALSAV